MLVRHILHTIRILRKSPGFTATSVLTLALGVGANTAVFSVVDAVLLRRLAYHDPDRLVEISHAVQGRGGLSIAPANLADYRRAGSFAGVAGYNRTSMTLTGYGAPEQVRAEAVTWNLFDVVGVQPVIGRAFRPEEDREGADRVVILTHALWRTKFGADPSVLGRQIALNGLPTVVVGVMPAGFEPLSQPGSGFTIHVLVPAAYTASELSNPARAGISLVGRLKPGVAIAEAQEEVRAIADGLARRFPETYRNRTGAVSPLRERSVATVRPALVIMLAAVGLVLLVACVNLGNLLIVRALGQGREAAIRLALGATGTQVAFELAIRGVVIGLLGGAVGLALGVSLRDILVSLAPPTVPGLDRIGLNLRVLAVTFGLATLTGVLAGLLPAFQLRHDAAAPILRQSALSTTSIRAVTRWRGILTALEIAAALVLAIGAGLLLRSMVRLTSIDLGFETRGVLLFAVRPPAVRYPDTRARTAFLEEIERRLQGVAGIESVAMASEFPLRGGSRDRLFLTGDTPDGRLAGVQVVSPGYFTTLSIPLVRGRLLGAEDRRGSQLTAVVSDLFEQRFLPGHDVIGRRFRLAPTGPEVTIVGVVGDFRRDGRQAALSPQVFLAAAQIESYPLRIEEFTVRTKGDAYALTPTIQRTIWSLDPDQPITNVHSLDEIVLGAEAGRRFNLLLLGALALVAVALALVGVYGVAAHAALQRTREIGIRIALGAGRRDVISLVVSDGVKWALAGTVVGLAGALAASRLMRGLLFEVAPTDATTFACAGAFTFAVAVLASYIPARRAAAADPLLAMRLE